MCLWIAGSDRPRIRASWLTAQGCRPRTYTISRRCGFASASSTLSSPTAVSSSSATSLNLQVNVNSEVNLVNRATGPRPARAALTATPDSTALLTSIPTVFKYLRYEPSAVPRRTERPQPRPPAGRGPPGVPGAGLLRRDPGPDRRRGGLFQGRGVLALRQQGRHVPGPARGPDRRAGRAERPAG